jgi:hypothetical protein
VSQDKQQEPQQLQQKQQQQLQMLSAATQHQTTQSQGSQEHSNNVQQQQQNWHQQILQQQQQQAILNNNLWLANFFQQQQQQLNHQQNFQHEIPFAIQQQQQAIQMFQQQQQQQLHHSLPQTIHAYYPGAVPLPITMMQQPPPVGPLLPGDVVWAKTSTKQPFWPGQVTDLHSKQSFKQLLTTSNAKNILIHFFGTHEFHLIPPVNIQRFQPQQSDVKKSKQKMYTKAMEELKVYYESGKLPVGWNDEEYISKSAANGSKNASVEDLVIRGNDGYPDIVTLITEHSSDFKPLSPLNSSNEAADKSRRERRLRILRRLMLIPPE